MKLKTSRFGEIEVDETRVITFLEGILGFEDYKKFIILDHDKSSPFQWLQSIESGKLAFVIMDPLNIVPDYTAEVSPEEIEDLTLSAPEKAVVLCIVNISKGCGSVTANLMGPIVVNPEKRLARQVVLTNSSYSIRHDISLPGRDVPKEKVQP